MAEDRQDDAWLSRYSRHILLPEIGIEGQERLSASSVLVVGCGGLGAAAVPYLAAAGVGRLVLADPDVVDLTNLQRQVAFGSADVGHLKVEAMRDAIRRLNPLVAAETLPQALNGDMLASLVTGVDVVLDCSDNFPTRRLVNRMCLQARKPLVSGAAVRFDGQLAVFDFRQADFPCYECLFPGEGDDNDGPCATFGVLSPLVGVIGSLQAVEALKLLLGIGMRPTPILTVFDVLRGGFRQMRFHRLDACPVCALA